MSFFLAAFFCAFFIILFFVLAIHALLKLIFHVLEIEFQRSWKKTAKELAWSGWYIFLLAIYISPFVYCSVGQKF